MPVISFLLSFFSVSMGFGDPGASSLSGGGGGGGGGGGFTMLNTWKVLS